MFRPPAVVNYNSHGSIHGHTQAERRPSSHQALVAHGRQQQLGQLISIICVFFFIVLLVAVTTAALTLGAARRQLNESGSTTKERPLPLSRLLDHFLLYPSLTAYILFPFASLINSPYIFVLRYRRPYLKRL